MDAWGELYRCRRKVRGSFPGLFRLPRVRRASRLARAILRPGVRILDVGAGRSGRGTRLAACVPDGTCVSVDPDPRSGAPHREISSVPGTFDLALCLEVIEHLALEEGLDLLREIRARLAPEGVLVLSTPNVYCPGRFLRDATHRTPYAWDELGGVLLFTGYRLRGLYRVVPGSLGRRLVRLLTVPLHLAVGTDHAPSIAAVAAR